MTTRPGYVWDATASEWVEIGQAAVVAPVAYQASEPVSPATGDIWIDSDDEVPSVDSTLYYRWTKTMSGGETSLSGTDDNSLALEYTPGYESVFINGVLQVRGLDYVATTGTTVTGLTALTASDVVMVESIVAYSVGDTYTQSQIGSLLDAKSPVSTTGLVLLNTTTFTTASSVSLNNAFNASYGNYALHAEYTGTVDNELTFRFRTSGSDNSTSNYQRNRWYSVGNTVTTSTNQNIGSIAQTTNGQDASFIADIINPFQTKYTQWYAKGNQRNTSSYAGYDWRGAFNGTTSFDGFTLIPASGTITGTIKVYGYK